MTEHDQYSAIQNAAERIQEITGSGAFTRGEVVAILITVLSEALETASVPEREGVLHSFTALMRELWADADAQRVR